MILITLTSVEFIVLLIWFILVKHKDTKIIPIVEFNPPNWKGRILKGYELNIIDRFRTHTYPDVNQNNIGNEITSILFDWKKQGFIDIEYGQFTIILKKLKEFSGLPEENKLWEILFKNRTKTSVAELKEEKAYKECAEIEGQLNIFWGSQVSKGYSKGFSKFLSIQIIALFVMPLIELFLFDAALFCLIFPQAENFWGLIVIAPSLIQFMCMILILFLVSIHSNKNQDFVKIQREVHGYRDYLEKTEVNKIKTLNDLNNKHFTYAMALGLLDEMTKPFWPAFTRPKN